MEILGKNPYWEDKELMREITLNTDENSLSKLVNFVCAYAYEAGFEITRIEEIKSVTYEALREVKKNAYGGKEGELSIECSITDVGALIVTITYYGKPYNILLSDIFSDSNEKKEKNVARMIKKVIGNVEYRRDAFKNVLIFTIVRPFS